VKHVCQLCVSFVWRDYVLNLHCPGDLNKHIGHLWGYINRNREHLVCHCCVPFLQISPTLYSSLIAALSALILCVAFHLKPSPVKNQDWLYRLVK